MLSVSASSHDLIYNISSVHLSIVLPCVFFLAALCRPPIYGYFHMYVHQRNGCNRPFSSCLQQNVGESGYAISSWSSSAGYLASM